MIMVSACLLGENCKYNGGNNRNEDLIEFCRTHDYVTICPETAAGLETPRVPSEITNVTAEAGGKMRYTVVSRDGKDLSELFDYGARLSLASVLVEAGNRINRKGIIEGAILKANSPSCGTGTVYDGTFTGTLTKGYGVFADRLLDEVVREIFDEYTSEENKLFSENFKVCDENNFKRVFGDR